MQCESAGEWAGAALSLLRLACLELRSILWVSKFTLAERKAEEARWRGTRQDDEHELQQLLLPFGHSAFARGRSNIEAPRGGIKEGAETEFAAASHGYGRGRRDRAERGAASACFGQI